MHSSAAHGSATMSPTDWAGLSKMELLGQDGNIFAILGRASALLKRAGMKDQADEMFQRVTASGSYEQALNIISEYVETELTPPPIHQKSNKKKARDAHER